MIENATIICFYFSHNLYWGPADQILFLDFLDNYLFIYRSSLGGERFNDQENKMIDHNPFRPVMSEIDF